MIIIETPAPPRAERLVLVPLWAASPDLNGGDLTIASTPARDATPADLARGGYERLGPEVLRVSAAEWIAMKLRAEGLEAHGEPGTLAHLRNDLRDAERERDEALGAHRSALAEQTARADTNFRAALKVQGDMTELRAALAHAQADNAKLRAELARLTAPGEGSGGEPTDWLGMWNGFTLGPLEDSLYGRIKRMWRAGVAHERARQQPEKARATDEELVEVYEQTPPASWGGTSSATRAGILAVAARVRQERCLVERLVAAGVAVRISRTSARVAGCTGMWDVSVTRRPDEPGEHFCNGVPTADVPSTLARLAGLEVGK